MVPLQFQSHRSDWSILAILFFAVLMIYLPLRGHQFLEPEDIVRIVGNPRFEESMNFGAAFDEFGHRHAGEWAPLAMVSLRIDAAIFGRESAAGFLTTNLLLHLLNSALLLAVLRRLGARTLVAGFVTLAFAVHPIQVETVARLGGRAELLGASFWMLALLFYTSRAAAPLGALRESGLLLCMVAGFTASRSILVLPVILLLLDLWPLARTDWRGAIIEKIPLVLVLVIGAIFLAKTSPGITGGFEATLPDGHRVTSAITAILLSIRDLVWPMHLSPFHVPPQQVSWAGTLAALGALIGIGVLCIREPAAVRMGCVLFLLLLAPALLIVGPEPFSRADHWLYLPVIGIAWILAASVRRWNRMNRGLGGAVLLFLTISAHAQVDVWQDTGSACARAIEVEPENWYAHARLGDLSRQAGEFQTAERHYLIALGQVPGFAWAQAGLADVIQDGGNEEAARSLYENVLLTRWEDEDAGRRLGFVLLRIDRDATAARLLESALAGDPGSGDLHAGLALAHARLGRIDSARDHREQALHYKPTTLAGQNSLAWLLATAPETTLRDPELALRIVALRPDTERSSAELLDMEAAALAAQGSFAEAFGVAQDAAALADNDGWTLFSAQIRDRAQMYLQGEIWTESRNSDPTAHTEVDEQGDGEDQRQDDPGHH
jgi:tetratricopeptide (TPR) repeat protein